MNPAVAVWRESWCFPPQHGGRGAPAAWVIVSASRRARQLQSRGTELGYSACVVDQYSFCPLLEFAATWRATIAYWVATKKQTSCAVGARAIDGPTARQGGKRRQQAAPDREPSPQRRQERSIESRLGWKAPPPQPHRRQTRQNRDPGEQPPAPPDEWQRQERHHSDHECDPEDHRRPRGRQHPRPISRCADLARLGPVVTGPLTTSS